MIKSQRRRGLMRKSFLTHYAMGILSVLTVMLSLGLVTAGIGGLVSLIEMTTIIWFQLTPGLFITKTITGLGTALICAVPVISLGYIPGVARRAKEHAELIIKNENDDMMNALTGEQTCAD